MPNKKDHDPGNSYHKLMLGVDWCTQLPMKRQKYPVCF